MRTRNSVRETLATIALTAMWHLLVFAQGAQPLAPAQHLAGESRTEVQYSGSAAASADELAQREQHLRTFLATHEDAVDSHYLLAYTLFLEAKARESLVEYTRAAALRTPTAKDLQTVALDYALLNDYEDADHWMTRVIAEEQQSFEAWYELGRIRYSRSRVTDALQCFQRALAIEPRSVKAENNLGLALEGLNRVDEAITAYRQAIDWQKDAPTPSEQPLLNLAIVLGNRGDLQAALDLVVQADRIAPRDPRVSEQLGRTYARIGNLPQAQAALERAAALEPSVAAIHFELGQVYRRQDKDEKAKAEFARAAALNGTHSSDQQR